MSAREELERATRRLEELAQRIADAAGRPASEVEELARQASDLSAAVAGIIPRAIAEAVTQQQTGSEQISGAMDEIARNVPRDSRSRGTLVLANRIRPSRLMERIDFFSRLHVPLKRFQPGVLKSPFSFA